MAFHPRIEQSPLASRLAAFDALRAEAGALDVDPHLAAWLRRQVEARGAHMSTSIEGNPMSEAEVRDLFAQSPETPGLAERENLDYRDGGRFARQYAADASARADGGFLRALHFLVVRRSDRYGTAGQIRTRQNRVVDGAGRTVYMPPAPSDVPGLTEALLEWISEPGDMHPLVVAAAAHLEFVNVHPFDDGNGRTARALTTYLVTRGRCDLDGFVTPEAAFGRERPAYYQALRVQGERYGERSVDLTAWCAWTIKRLLLEAAFAVSIVRQWSEFLEGPPARMSSPRVQQGFMYVALADSVSRSEYARALQVSTPTAASDLREMVHRGLVRREGATRAARYVSVDKRADEIADAALQSAYGRFGDL